MRSKLTLAIGMAVLGVGALALPAWSHHAHGNYVNATKDMEGVVTEFHALNPHSWIYLEVTEAPGKSQVWAMEGSVAAPLLQLAKEGKGLKVGDKVKVRCHPLTDGSSGCLLGYIRHPDGTVRDYDEGAKETRVEGF